MKASTMGAALAASILLAQAGTADAQFSAAELKCRGAVAKNTSKLISMVEKTMTGCHKARDGKFPSQNCTSVADADVKDIVAKAEAKLRLSVGGAKDACVGIAPATLGFDSCPAPCSDTIATFSDVADCMICLARTEDFTAIDTVLGYPAAPSGGIEAKCRGAISKAHSKQLSTVIKTRTKCQGLSDKGGGTTTAPCEGVADAKITTGRSKGEDGILKACQPANLVAVDSCDTSSISALQDCVMDNAEDTAESLYVKMYGGPEGAFTWTEINALFQLKCSGASCHTAGGTQGGHDLGGTPAQNYAEVVNAPEECGSPSTAFRVVPGNPDASFLMDKLDHVADCGDNMPLLQVDPLPAGERERIRLWILEGAPNN